MARRDVIIPVFYEPGGESVVITEVHFLLVDKDHNPLPGFRIQDDDSVVTELTVTTSTEDVVVSLTPQTEIYTDTYWRVRIPTPSHAGSHYRSRSECSEYYVQMSAGAPITLREFLGSTLSPSEEHLSEPTFSQLHNPDNAVEGQVPTWSDAQQAWLAATPTGSGGGVVAPYVVALPPTTLPTAGQVSRDNADPTLVTKLFLNQLDSDGTNQDGILSALKAGDWSNIQLATDAGQYEQYDVTGPATKNSGVWTIPVTFFGQSTTFNDTDAVNSAWRIEPNVAIEGLSSSSAAGKIAETDGLGTVRMIDTPLGGVGTHATLPDLGTSGHPGSVINFPGGVVGNAVSIDANGNLQDAGTAPGGTGQTDITVTQGTMDVAIQSSSGSDDVITVADGAVAGVMSVSLYNSLVAALAHAQTTTGNPHNTDSADTGSEQAGAVDAHNIATTAHGNKLPTAEEKAAMQNADTPGAGNPFVTVNGVSGYMDISTYDPTSVSADVFDRANHIGTQTLATISDAGDSASRNVGVGIGDVAQGDAPATVTASHDANVSAHSGRIPNANQKSALDAANGPTGANAFATLTDIAAAGGGDMLASMYDPTSVADDAFDRANHQGTQTLTTISDAGTSASRDVGVGALQVAQGDAPAAAVSGHNADGTAHSNVLPTADEKAAMGAANAPAVGNAFATLADVGGGGGDMEAATYDPTGIVADAFARANHTGTQTLATISDAGSSASRDVGNSSGDVAQGDAPAVAVSGHNADGTAHSNVLPTADEKAAMGAANAPTALNAFATVADVGGITDISITTRTGTNYTIASSSGDDAVAPPATNTLAGLSTAAQVTTLEATDPAGTARPPTAHTHPLAEITDSGDSASRDVGTGAGDVAQGDAPAAAVSGHNVDGTAHSTEFAKKQDISTGIGGSYTNTNVSLDTNGRITAISNGVGGGGGELPRIEVEITTAGMGASVGNHHLLTVSGMTSYRSFVLPVGTSDGDVIEWELITDAPADYELLLSGAPSAPITLRNTDFSADTTVTRYFIKGESGRAVWDGTNSRWRITAEDDGRIPSSTRLTLSAAMTTNSAGAIYTVTLDTEDAGSVGNIGDTIGNRVVLRRDGTYLVAGQVTPNSAVTAAKFIRIFVYDASSSLIRRALRSPATGTYVDLNAVDVRALSSGNFLYLKQANEEANIGTSGLSSATFLSVIELF